MKKQVFSTGEVLCSLCCPSVSEIVEMREILGDEVFTSKEKKDFMDELLKNTDYCPGCYEIIRNRIKLHTEC